MAQPLYVKGISISGTAYNMVIAATVNGTLFAWAEGGTLLWSRQGTTGTLGTNALYHDDCGTNSTPVTRHDTLQFEGVLSTPTIDASESQYSQPVMFVTSYCETSSGVQQWWIHEIDLTTGLDAVAAHHIGGTGDFSSINESWQQQRSALLEITNSYNTTTPNLIYALFGTGVQENIVSQDYTGWVVMYTSASSGLVKQHAYSDEPLGSSGLSGCTGGGMTAPSGSTPSLYNGQCTTNSGNTGLPGCDCLVYVECPVAGDTCNYSTGYCSTPPNTAIACKASPYQFAPNWGGHGGGCWMSGNGPAATVANAIGGDDSVHVFFGCGNGGFEAFDGSTPSASNDNGQSIMDFKMTATNFNQTKAFQTFTPYSPAFGVGPQPPPDSVCNCTSDLGGINGTNSQPAAAPDSVCNCTGNPPTGCQPCTTTLQTLNVYDHDMAVGGVALFNDLAGNPRLVSADKAGYGYLFYQGQLCGSSYNDTECVAFGAGDTGSWTFGASSSLCSGTDPAGGCDRVAGMAVFDNQGSNSTRCGNGSGARCVYLIDYPNNERLTAALLSDNAYAWPGVSGQILTWSSGSSNTLGLPSCTGAGCACTYDQNCLGDQIVVGDTLALAGCTCVTGACPTVTSVTDASDGSASSLTINTSVNTAYGSSCTSGQGFTRTGWLVTPAHDVDPGNASGIGFPGGAVTVSANCTSTPCTNALIWVITPSHTAEDGTQNRGLGILWAYKALPNADDHLAEEYRSTDTWCASSYARPTIVNGSAYVPTYAVSCPSGKSGCGRVQTFSTCYDTQEGMSGSIGVGGPYPSGLLQYH